MRNKVPVAILIIAITFILSLYLYLNNNRFYIISTGQLTAHKIDRKTGKVWFIMGENQTLLKENEETKSPKDKAIELTKKSLDYDNYQTVENEIHDIMQKQTGNIKINGWSAQKIDQQTFLVNYYYIENDSGIVHGWWFEVNVPEELVRFVNDDSELQKKYSISFN